MSLGKKKDPTKPDSGIPHGNLQQATRKAAKIPPMNKVILGKPAQWQEQDSWVLPVIKYPAGIIRCPEEEIQTIGVKA